MKLNSYYDLGTVEDNSLVIADVKNNPYGSRGGIWISEGGKVFKLLKDDSTIVEEVPIRKAKNGYSYIRDDDVFDQYSVYTRSGKIEDENGGSYTGKFLHRIVVFTFGDCDDRKYSNVGNRNIIDHKDMNKENNRKANLQLVSNGINLFRAYYRCKSPDAQHPDETEVRFKEYYYSLDSVDRKILDIEIQLDLEGKY